MSQPVFEPRFEPETVTAAPVTRPAAVIGACLVMFAYASVGGVFCLVGMFNRVARISHFETELIMVVWDREFQFFALLFAMCALIAALVIQVWQGGSAARLAGFAVLGSAVILVASQATAFLASVGYGIDQPYEEDWRRALIATWVYLAVAVALAIPIPLLNRPAAVKWFRSWRPALSPPDAMAPVRRPEVLTLVTTALIVLAVLLMILKGWAIGMIVSGDVVKPENVTEDLIRTLATAVIPLLIITAAVVEIRAGSRLGQTAAFTASGYACLVGLERLPYLFNGHWLNDGQQFGMFFTTAAIGVIGAGTLFALLRPRVLDYLVYHSVDLEPDYELAADAEDDEDEEAAAADLPGSPEPG